MDNYEMVDAYRDKRIIVCGPLAMAYVPIQKFRNLYDPAKALEQGTLFKELDLPYLGRGGYHFDR